MKKNLITAVLMTIATTADQMAVNTPGQNAASAHAGKIAADVFCLRRIGGK